MLRDMSKHDKPFKLPQAFLNQLEEFTCGYHLVMVNAQGEFETFSWHPNKITELALLNYIDIQSTAVQAIIRQRTIDKDIEEEEEEG